MKMPTRAPLRAPSTPAHPAAERQGEPALRGLHAEQLWAGRTVLYVREVARALHVTEQHVINLITEGRLRAINVGNGLKSADRPKGSKTAREYWRIPVSAWDAYILENAS